MLCMMYICTYYTTYKNSNFRLPLSASTTEPNATTQPFFSFFFFNILQHHISVNEWIFIPSGPSAVPSQCPAILPVKTRRIKIIRKNQRCWRRRRRGKWSSYIKIMYIRKQQIIHIYIKIKWYLWSFFCVLNWLCAVQTHYVFKRVCGVVF